MRTNKNKIRNKSLINLLNIEKDLTNYYFTINESLFKWEGLPDTVNEFYFNKFLFFEGRACFFKKYNEIFGLKFAGESNFNLYAEPTEGFALGFGQSFPTKNYTTFTKENVNCVVIHDSFTKTNIYNLLKPYIKMLANLVSLYNSLIYQSKTSSIILCEQSQVKTIENLLYDMSVDVPFVIGVKALSNIFDLKIEALPSRSDELATIYNEINKIDNKIRQLMGVNSLNTIDKRERMVVDEININNQSAFLNIQNRLKSRKDFCEKVNDLFGLNVNVDLSDAYKKDLKYDSIKYFKALKEEEGNENVDL